MMTLSVIKEEHTPQLITFTLVTVKGMFRVKTTSQTEERSDRTRSAILTSPSDLNEAATCQRDDIQVIIAIVGKHP